jgi:hypothetical protein
LWIDSTILRLRAFFISVQFWVSKVAGDSQATFDDIGVITVAFIHNT